MSTPHWAGRRLLYAPGVLSKREGKTNRSFLVCAVGPGSLGADQASLLAKSVYEGVKQRMSQLQTDAQEREKRLAAQQSQLEALAVEHESALRRLQLEQQVSMCCHMGYCILPQGLCASYWQLHFDKSCL